ncbi:hypothetical protein [Paraglaciecola sp. L1A13]|uniref:hypothetical protein n=1 Tax=Paraglaciecola sp. L1A13 TaxID=2686359 RepID=UPI00131D60F0|nr:hypothetical protein [Paraglaciecola sp. L1A13]
MSIIEQFSLNNTQGVDTSLLLGANSEAGVSASVDSATSASLESVTGVGAYFADILASMQGAATDLIGSDANSTSQSDSATSTEASSVAATGLFASLISSDDEASTTSTLSSSTSIIGTALTSDESLSQIQQQLMASLNASLFGGLLGDTVGTDGATSLLSGIGSSFSDESLSIMQSNLLANLHSSLFSGLLSADGTMSEQNVTSTEDSTASNEAESGYSFLQNMSQFSFGDDGFGLNELFDTVNIAQHVPVVSSLYQDMTGEHMSAAASLAGGFLYGGPTGLALSAVDLMVEGYTGSTVSDAIVDFDYAGYFFGNNSAATAAQEALKTNDEPIESSTNAYQFVSRLF